MQVGWTMVWFTMVYVVKESFEYLEQKEKTKYKNRSINKTVKSDATIY